MRRKNKLLRILTKAVLAATLVVTLTVTTASAIFTVNAVTLKPGDANADGTVNTKDVLLMRKYLAKMDVTINNVADINHDTFIDTKDLLLLRKGLAGMINLDDYVIEQPEDALASNVKKVGSKMTSPISQDEYTLKWIDDFSGEKLDESNWSYFTRNYNQAEESVNRKENVTVDDGILNIWAKKEDKTYTGDAESWETPKVSNFTSGAINTQGKQSFKYGRLEIKCKIPYSYGMWAAFWTMGVNKGWPWCGETDIMEFVGGTAWGNDRDNEYLSNLHWCDPDLPSSLAWSTGTEVSATNINEGTLPLESKLNCGFTYQPKNIDKMNDDWHICGVEWTEKYMTFYCDEVPYLTVDITRSSMREAYHQPHYMILNLVMGGSWAGTPNDDTVFPQSLAVDWVKVWQKA